MAHVIAEPCLGVKDKACVQVCPVDCIQEGERMLYIDPALCIDCQLCVPECPAAAIFREAELPERWRFYAEVNRAFFPEMNEAKAWAGHAPTVGKGL